MMDTEPGRCRRTDGKKWRCHGSVVPDQKYCARHMHRGSQRSRKLVEASKDIQRSYIEGLSSDKSGSPINSSSTAVMSGRMSVPISTSLDLMVPSSNSHRRVSATGEGGSTFISYNSSREGSSAKIVHVDSGTTKSSLLRAQVGKNNSRNEINWPDFRGLGFSHFNKSKTYWSNQGKKNYCKPSIAAGFGVSPKSVLQGIGCSNLSFDCKTRMETEALRCRRTDGKRWRCSRDVVPDKKYCESHLHRGAKKAMVDSKLVTGTPVDSPAGLVGTHGTPEKVVNCQSLNTNLSISIAASPREMSESDSSNSGDATTVSDENATVSHILTLISMKFPLN